MKQPTKEQLQSIAPTCNMMFALSMVLETLSINRNEKVYELACKLRARVNEYVPDVAESFGDWSEQVENEIISTPFKTDDVINWLIAKIYDLCSDFSKFYRQFDKTFVYNDQSVVNELKTLQTMYDKKVCKELNLITKKLMEI